jgi:hypothetical protein
MLVDFWAGLGLTWQIVGILAVVSMVVLLFLWPSSVVPMVLAGIVVVASVIVTWDQVADYRTQKATGTTFSPQAGITEPAPPAYPRSGT